MQKIRYSKQRELIYENLKARYDHPTAEAIYADLKKDHPALSLGTVYRNLSLLADTKKIRKLDVGQSIIHYDADLSNHHHFVCNKCHQVYDIYYDDYKFTNDMRKLTEHQIEKTDIVFSGICENCLKNEGEN